jgi:hypothetical protein
VTININKEEQPNKGRERSLLMAEMAETWYKGK